VVAEDASSRAYPLSVEFIRGLPECQGVTAVVIRLHDDLGDIGDVLLSLTFRGLRSNRARVGIGHTGGGPPDDPPPTPSIVANPSSVNWVIHQGQMPPATNITVTTSNGSNWSTNDTSNFYSASVACYGPGGGVCVTGALTTLSSPTEVAGFAPGTYSAPLTIMAAGLPNRTVQVTLTVTAVTGTPTPTPTPTPAPTPSPTPTPTPTPAPTPTGPAFYVAPNGSASGNGSINNPWDLQTALNQPSGVQPGATIYLRGGTYNGKFTSALAGTVSSPIVVRAYPGEWAKIEGYVTTTLSGNISASATTVTLSNASRFNVGQVITFHDQPSESAEEQVHIYGKTGNTLNVVRGWNGTTPRSHNTGALCVLGGSQLTLNGTDTIYQDFEVTNSDPVRIWDVINTQNAPHLRGACVFLIGARNKLVNLAIHDCENGVFTSSQASNTEIYGTLVYNNGYEHPGRTAGHGLYVQSNSPTFRIEDDIVFNNFLFGIQAVSQTGNSIGFHFEDNAAFNNGAVPYDTDVRNPGILVGANNGYADQITLINNYLYQPSGTGGGSLRLGYTANNGTINISNNYIMGNSVPVMLSNWQSLTGSGNKVFIGSSIPSWSNKTLVEDHPLAGRSISWNNNSYYNMSGSSTPFTFNLTAYSFAGWKQATGTDASSTYSTSLPPSLVIVRPNQYQPGRGNIIVYNWPRFSSVTVNLSTIGLINGQSYSIINAQNFHNGLAAPLFNGVYSPATPSITLNLLSGAALATATPVGYSFNPLSTSPEFAVFVVIPQ